MELVSEQCIHDTFAACGNDLPRQLFSQGNLSLLSTPKIAIIGSRKASKYARQQTQELARLLSHNGMTIVSGAAEGIDAAAHEGAFPRTIAVMGNGLDIYYPSVNTPLIQKIYRDALALSEYAPDERARAYTFVRRNRLVVAMSQAIVVAEAQPNSGSMRSAEFARQFGIPIYVLSHRIGESEGTNKLLEEGVAKAIYSLETFVSEMCHTKMNDAMSVDSDEITYAKTFPTQHDFFERFGERLYELEFEGKITIEHGIVKPL